MVFPSLTSNGVRLLHTDKLSEIDNFYLGLRWSFNISPFNKQFYLDIRIQLRFYRNAFLFKVLLLFCIVNLSLCPKCNFCSSYVYTLLYFFSRSYIREILQCWLFEPEYTIGLWSSPFNFCYVSWYISSFSALVWFWRPTVLGRIQEAFSTKL